MTSTHRPGARVRRVARSGVGVLGTALAALTVPAGEAAAQESPLVMAARGGAAIPVGTFSNGAGPGEGTSPAPSFGVDFALAGGGRWTPYVGFSQHRFGCEDAGCPSGGRYVATGFRAGLRLVPFPVWSVLPWLAMGALTTHVEAGDLGAANAGLSDLAVGGEVGLGVHIGSASRIGLEPAVRVAAVNARLPDGSLLSMRYLVADLALVLSF